MGRAHDVKEGLAALEAAQNAFKRVSFDLIYARPEQSEAGWQAELEHALSFGTSHLSLYQPTIEPGTRFDTLVRKGEFTPADPDHEIGRQAWRESGGQNGETSGVGGSIKK